MAHDRSREVREPTVELYNKPKASIVRDFKQNCDDEDLIRQKANMFRLEAGKYRVVRDDAELCVMALTDKHKKMIETNVNLLLPTISMATDIFVDVPPVAKTVLTGLSNNTDKISGWVSWVYTPDFVISRNPEEDDSPFLYQTDEKTLKDVKKVLDECNVPKEIGGGIIDSFSEGIGFSSLMTAVRAALSYWAPKPTNSAGLAKKADKW